MSNILTLATEERARQARIQAGQESAAPSTVTMWGTLHSVEGAAGVLSVGRTSPYALIDSGELERVKIGRRSLVSADSIAAYVERLGVCEMDEQG